MTIGRNFATFTYRLKITIHRRFPLTLPISSKGHTDKIVVFPLEPFLLTWECSMVKIVLPTRPDWPTPIDVVWGQYPNNGYPSWISLQDKDYHMTFSNKASAKREIVNINVWDRLRVQVVSVEFVQ